MSAHRGGAGAGRSSRGWWRDYFHDHPLLSARPKNDTAWSGSLPKVYCKACFAHNLAEVRRRDELEVQSGLRVSVRENMAIEDLCMWFL